MSEMNGFAEISKEDKERLALSGINTENMDGRSGSFLLVNDHVLHASGKADGVEIMMIDKALEKYAWLKDYFWNIVPADKDQYTKYVAEHPQRGYCIIAHKGAKTTFPLQSCMFMQGEDTIQAVHNIVIAEEGAEIHLIAGCASSLKTKEGAHYGINEIYVGKNAKVTSTMIHTWGKEIEVFPRTASVVEEGGTFISNYVCMKQSKLVQMYPVSYLKGEGAVARFSSVIVAGPGSNIDAGSRAVLQAKGTSAELITRAITNGGNIVSRGAIVAEVPQTKGHIECRGLILKDGLMHAIPEIEGRVVDVELSHEAAVGKIARDEIEYLMARGLSEDEATSTIIRGFLDVKIEGLPDALQKQIDAAIDSADHGF
ncbi:MAG TPA: SufD family Fe-S cluster assembly protein [Methanocorpusculum sp.]|nr:SufD family Fe-S cluster assembly protein [Methanocorpusculum sp.]